MAAYETKRYRNLFLLIGKEQVEVKRRLDEIYEEFFYGGSCVYHEAGKDMAYIEDTGNHDARTEGMSYGMMMCVQMDRKREFDRLWRWAKTYMYMDEGENEGYFAWSCRTDGAKNSYGPAPDGEEFFAMALFFASHRWGDGEGIFNYSREAKDILRSCLHKGEGGRPGRPMWNRDNKQILFIPGIDFTDPSYHLPHFYELFSLWACEEDREFWKQAATASRRLLASSCHPVTGLSAEYAEFDGSPLRREEYKARGRHDWFYSDAYRTAANIGLDFEWFGKDEGQRIAAARLQHFFGVTNRDNPYKVFEVDGTMVDKEALHPVGVAVTAAQASLAVIGSGDAEAEKLAAWWIERLWNLPMREGERRYYDNCLYVFAFLALSGNYRIW